MAEKIKNQSPPKSKLDKEPGKPGFDHGHTGLPKQEVEVVDEDVKAEKEHESAQPKQNTDDETRKVVNEEEQEQVVNADESATEKPAKMKG